MALLGLLCLTSLTFATTDLVGIPTLPWKFRYGRDFDLSTVHSIVVDPNCTAATDSAGWTLIPPTLQDFATTFASDWKDIVGENVEVAEGSSGYAKKNVYLTLGNSSEYVDAAGRWTSEAYTLEVKPDGITITGASPLGVWWGTRSLLQQAALSGGRIRLGSATDAPGWNTRGVMLDAGRHYYPPEFITEMCAWMSFYKQNIFHLHISDNLYNNVDIYSRERQLSLYAAFRLWSDDPAVAGLNKRRNESYTRDDFEHIQSACALRGVTVIPEIEAPGHALVITQWKEELGIPDSLDLLNLTNPDSTEQMKVIWKTFLPWFHSKVVHIGADEYVDDALPKNALAVVYNDFVNTMNDYIYQESGKSIRIWGTFPPQKNYTNNIATNVSIQHWEFFEDNPLFDYINNKYSVINSDDHNYIVTKYSTSYRQILNKTLIFHGNPIDGGPFAPYVFDPNNATNNPAKPNPYVLGHLAAQWNDYGPNTSTYLEAYYSWRDYLPALADKQWGGSLTEDQYDHIYGTLQLAAPGQNLDRRIQSPTRTIFEYDFDANSREGIVKDLTKNQYDAKTNCSTAQGALQVRNGCSAITPLTSKGWNYTLSFTIKQDSNTPGTLFNGPDSELRSGNGTSNKIMLVSAGNAFALNYSLPIGEWVDAALIARGNRTYFTANNSEEMEFLTVVGVNGASFAWAPMAIVAPLQTIGGGAWEGSIKSVKLVDYAPKK